MAALAPSPWRGPRDGGGSSAASQPIRARVPSSAQAGAREGLAVGFHPEKDLTDPAAKREAFWLAAEQGELERVNAFADRTLIDSRDEFGRGALARAARAGKADAVALLIKRGAAVDAADS